MVISRNLNHLATFHAVARAGSMTRGAERLDFSQPAVPKQVQELERALGVPLFDRIGRRVRLSQVGELLADYAQRHALAVCVCSTGTGVQPMPALLKIRRRT